MKKALLYIVRSIVTSEDLVEVSEEEEDGIINFTIKVAVSDMGRVIGKSGKVIRSIRNVLKINALKQNKKINITLAENSTP